MKKHTYSKADVKAIKRSIKHWQEDYKELVLFGGNNGFDAVFNTRTCNCCGRFDPDGFDCTRCPLADVELSTFTIGCNGDSSYYAACRACRLHNKAMFMKARRSIINRLKRAAKRTK